MIYLVLYLDVASLRCSVPVAFSCITMYTRWVDQARGSHHVTTDPRQASEGSRPDGSKTDRYEHVHSSTPSPYWTRLTKPHLGLARAAIVASHHCIVMAGPAATAALAWIHVVVALHARPGPGPGPAIDPHRQAFRCPRPVHPGIIRASWCVDERN